MADQPPNIVWFRDDLRLSDHPALHAAANTGAPVICLYVPDEASRGVRPLGGAVRWWLAQSALPATCPIQYVSKPVELQRIEIEACAPQARLEARLPPRQAHELD
jgi:deoxyribodipyrimidine photo-lyase